MAQGPHSHDWHYNEAQPVYYTNPNEVRWEVVKFCAGCGLVENLKLHQEKHES